MTTAGPAVKGNNVPNASTGIKMPLNKVDEAHLLSCASSLGRTIKGVYRRDEHCYECLHDMQQFLRRDSCPAKPVATQLVVWNVVFKDLLPLLKNYPTDQKLIQNVLKIIVFLTLPPENDVENTPARNTQLLYRRTVIDLLLADVSATKVLLSLLIVPLRELESGVLKGGAGGFKNIELVFTFIRNVVLGSIEAQNTSSPNSVRKEELMSWFFECSVDELLLTVSQDTKHVELRTTSFMILEIIRCLCSSMTGQSYISQTKFKFDSPHRDNRLHSTRSQWKSATRLTISRFAGHYHNDTVCRERVRNVITQPIRPVHVEKDKAIVVRTSNHDTPAHFLQKFRNTTLSCVLDHTFKELQSARDNISSTEESIRVHDFLQVLTYFLETPSFTSDGKSCEEKCDSAFSRIFNTAFIRYLKLTWEKFNLDRNHFGLIVMDYFMRAFLCFLERNSNSKDTKIKCASRTLIEHSLASKHECSLLQFALKRLSCTENKSASVMQLGVQFENVKTLSNLQKRVATSRGGNIKMHVDSALLRRIAKQFISCVNLDIHEACEALLFCLERILSTDCDGLNHIEMFQTFVQISQIEQTSNFILRRSNVMRFMMRWARQSSRRFYSSSSRGSAFVKQLFSPNVYVVL